MHYYQQQLCFLLLLISGYAQAQTALTIYSTASAGTDLNYLNRSMSYKQNNANSIPGYALVQEQRDITLAVGKNLIPYTPIPMQLDPTTVIFESSTDPKGTQLLDQSYHFDLINNQRLLQKYLGKEIIVEQTHGDQIETLKGTLLNADSELVLQDPNGVVTTLKKYSKIRFENLPEQLMIKPTLLWNINAKKPGNHKIKTSYQSNGFTWWANYNATYQESSPNSGTMQLSAWANIVNQSGLDFSDVSLKLVAGNVNKVNNSPSHRGMAMMSKAEDIGTNTFQESTLLDYHIYTLDQKTTLVDSSTKQIALFENKTDIPVKKEYIYQDNQYSRYSGYVNKNNSSEKQFPGKVDTYLTFQNNPKDGLGIPLPAGKIRVTVLDEQKGTNEFIGEDAINHTTTNEEISIKLGSAYDIIGYKKQLDFKVDNNRRFMSESFEVTIKNRKQNAVHVLVKENIHRSANWKIIDPTIPYQKLNAQTISFPVDIGKESEVKLRYTVEYRW